MVFRLLHYIYEDPARSPENLLAIANTWKKHPDWEYRFWDKQMIPDFLEYYHARPCILKKIENVFAIHYCLGSWRPQTTEGKAWLKKQLK